MEPFAGYEPKDSSRDSSSGKAKPDSDADAFLKEVDESTEDLLSGFKELSGLEEEVLLLGSGPSSGIKTESSKEALEEPAEQKDSSDSSSSEDEKDEEEDGGKEHPTKAVLNMFRDKLSQEATDGKTPDISR